MLTGKIILFGALMVYAREKNEPRRSEAGYFRYKVLVSSYAMRLRMYHFGCLVHATNISCPGEFVDRARGFS